MLLKVQPGHPPLRLVASLAASLCRLGQVELSTLAVQELSLVYWGSSCVASKIADETTRLA